MSKGQEDRPMVYFVQFIPSMRIKVGYGMDEYHVGRRINQARIDGLKGGNKIKVLRVIEGGYQKEQAILRQWAHVLVPTTRETFESDPAFLGWILSQKPVDAIFPAEVRDATEPLKVTLTQWCIVNGQRRNSRACVMALAIGTQYRDHYEAADVGRSRVLLIREDGVAIRYGVLPEMRKAQITLDDDGKWDTSLVPAGEYYLPVLCASARQGGRPNRHHLYGGSGRKRQTAKRSSRPVVRFDRMLTK